MHHGYVDDDDEKSYHESRIGRGMLVVVWIPERRWNSWSIVVVVVAFAMMIPTIVKWPGPWHNSWSCAPPLVGYTISSVGSFPPFLSYYCYYFYNMHFGSGGPWIL